MKKNNHPRFLIAIPWLIVCLTMTLSVLESSRAMDETKAFPYEGTFTDQLEVGETWVFEHHGVRTSGTIGQPVDGRRIQEVVSTHEVEGIKAWIMRDKWGDSDVEPARYFLDAKRNLIRVEYGASIATPSTPIRFCLYDLKPGEEKSMKTVMKSETDETDISIHYSRLVDETLQLPAGEFQNCQKVKMVMTIVSEQTQNKPLDLHYMLWYHPKANGMVKESFLFMPPSQDGQNQPPLSGVSLLKSYTPAPKER